METDKFVKVLNEETGQEVAVKEKVAPYIILARAFTSHIKMAILGTSAGNKIKEKEFMQTVAADLQDPNNPLGGVMRSALPGALLRAQKSGDYAPLVQLVIGQYLGEYMKKRQSQPQAPSGPNADASLRF
jgi:hypothetical protein